MHYNFQNCTLESYMCQSFEDVRFLKQTNWVVTYKYQVQYTCFYALNLVHLAYVISCVKEREELCWSGSRFEVSVCKITFCLVISVGLQMSAFNLFTSTFSLTVYVGLHSLKHMNAFTFEMWVVMWESSTLRLFPLIARLRIHSLDRCKARHHSFYSHSV